MPSIQDYNLKLNRLKNTRKITQTMKLVSMSKLTRAQDLQRKSKDYSENLTDLISRLTDARLLLEHPFIQTLQPPGTQRKALILLITSDRGLCGGFNNNLIRSVNHWIDNTGKDYNTIDFSYCGRRGYSSLRAKYPQKHYYEHVTAKPDFMTASQIGQDLSGMFLNGEYTEIFVAYNHFISALSQKPQIDKILPIETKPLYHPESKMTSVYQYEPGVSSLLSFLIPKYLYFTIYYALLENAAGEHGARMTAMESATKNTQDLISRLTLIRNRARQSKITAELTEIIAGSEALNQ